MLVAFVSYLAGFICFGLLIVTVPGLKVHRGTGSNALLAKSHPAGEPMNEEAAQLSAVIAVPAANAPAATSVENADRILVVKSEHTLTLLSHGKAIKVYKVALGSGGLGPKDHEGDRKTPEGTYIIDRKNSRTLWHLTLHISYPNAADRARAVAEHLSPGGDIMIHGITKQFEYLGAMQANWDWTYGCIALSNPELDEVSRLVPIGTPIEIRH
jgi:murein L,D-transpeptidase YafK